MNVPKLRFKDDDGRVFSEWRNVRFGNIATFSKGKGICKADIALDGITPCLRYGELYTEYGETIQEIKSSTNVSPNELQLSEANDVIIPASGETQLDIARAACVLVDGVALGGDLNIIKCKENGVFLSYYLNHQKKLEIAKLAQGNSVVHLYSSQLKVIDLKIPSLPEQTKIANFLTAIDERISQLTQKCDLLAQYKKGVMQQIFSQQIRFKDEDGREFPEWEEMPLSQFLIPIARKISKPENQYLAIGIRSHFKGTFQKPGSEPEKIAMEDLYEVRPNDLIVNITFAWEGAVAIAKNEDAGGLVSHRFPTFEFNEHHVKSEFFRYVYPTNHFKYLLGLCSPGGAGRNRVLNKSDFLKIESPIPCLAEQTKIANFLTAIDNKITQTKGQLEAVKQYKKGLLQQMFV